MKRTNFILLLLVLLTLGCKKKTIKKDADFLIGKWRWEYSKKKYCPNYACYTTRINETGVYMIEFKKNGWIKYYENGVCTKIKRARGMRIDKKKSGSFDVCFDRYCSLNFYIFGNELDSLVTGSFPFKVKKWDSFGNYNRHWEDEDIYNYFRKE